MKVCGELGEQEGQDRCFCPKAQDQEEQDDAGDGHDDDGDADLGELLLVLRHLLDHLAEVPHALGSSSRGRGDPLLFVECLE